MGRKKKSATLKQPNKSKLNVHAIAFVQVSDLVPQSWYDWFWEVIADGAPFTWGDNDYSIIAVSSFINWCERVIDPEEEGMPPKEDLDIFYRRLRSLGNLWLDMECKTFSQQW